MHTLAVRIHARDGGSLKVRINRAKKPLELGLVPGWQTVEVALVGKVGENRIELDGTGHAVEWIALGQARPSRCPTSTTPRPTSS